MTSHEAISHLLVDHHRELESACTALLGRTFADEPAELVAEYRRFERAVLEHIDAEEEAMVVAYAEHDPADAAGLRDDHAMLRRLLYQLGVDVELHTIRADRVSALVELLHRHAAHEERGMYRWMETHGVPHQKRRLIKRIATSLTELTQRRDVKAPVVAAGTIEHIDAQR